MIRKHAFSLAVLVAAASLIGGTLAIVQGQQPSADKTPVAGAPGKAAVSAPKGAANTATGGTYPRGAFGGQPGELPRMGHSMMGAMGMAADDDPEMTALFQAEAGMAQESAEILARFTESDNAGERKKIAAELRAALAKQFDVQRQRRELELGRIEDQVRKLREQIKKRDDARETIIDRRLDQLINEVEGLGWTPAAQGSHGPAGGHAGAEMMRSMMPGARSKTAPAKR